MNYHLGWLYTSLELAHSHENKPRVIDPSCIKATQEDVDFLLAFVDSSGNTHIIIFEAQGDTSFTNKQCKRDLVRGAFLYVDFGFEVLCRGLVIAFFTTKPGVIYSFNQGNFKWN